MNPFRRHPVIRIAALLVYVFLYAPIIVLILYSFRGSASVWK
jgi:ABC-type spermidine/putrescine transport system permease subunit II